MVHCIDHLKGRTSGGTDGLVDEILQALPPSAVELLAALYRLRFVNLDGDDHLWRKILVVLVPKVSNLQSIGEFRPISVFEVLNKLYFRCICCAVKGGLNDSIVHNIFSYRPKYQTLDEINTLRRLVEKTNEWDIPMCYCRTDIIKAYDMFNPDIVIKALRHHDVAPSVIDAILREWYHQGQVFTWQGVSTRPVRRSRGLPQGDPLAPWVFNAVIDYLLRPLRDSWAARRFGINISETRLFQEHWLRQTLPQQPPRHISFVNLLVFADDLVLVARHPEDLAKMMKELEQALSTANWFLDTSKTQWSHNLAVAFPDTDRHAETVSSLRKQLSQEHSRLLNQCRRIRKQIRAEQEEIESRKSCNSVRARVLDAIAKAEIDEMKQQLQKSTEDLHTGQAQLADTANMRCVLDFTFKVSGTVTNHGAGNRPFRSFIIEPTLETTPLGAFWPKTRSDGIVLGLGGLVGV